MCTFIKLKSIMKLTRPAIIRMIRRAGIKSISNECIDKIRNMIIQELEFLIKKTIIITKHKSIMSQDIYDCFYLLGINISQSENLGTNTIEKI